MGTMMRSSLLLLAAATLLPVSSAFVPSQSSKSSSALFVSTSVKPTPSTSSGWNVMNDGSVIGRIENHPERRDGQHITTSPLRDADTADRLVRTKSGRKSSIARQRKAARTVREKKDPSYPPGTTVRIVRGVHGKTRPVGKVKSESARMVYVHVESLGQEVHVRKSSIEMVTMSESNGMKNGSMKKTVKKAEVRNKSASRLQLAEEDVRGVMTGSAAAHMDGDILNLVGGESEVETTTESKSTDRKVQATLAEETTADQKAAALLLEKEEVAPLKADREEAQKEQEQATLKAVKEAAHAVHKVARKASTMPKNQEQVSAVATKTNEATDTTSAFQASIIRNKMDMPPPMKTETVERETVIESALEPKSVVEETNSVGETSAVKSAVEEQKTDASPVVVSINKMDTQPPMKTEIVEEAPVVDSAVEPQSIMKETKSVVESSADKRAVTKQKTEAFPVAALINKLHRPRPVKTEIVEETPVIESAVESNNVVEETNSAVETSVVKSAVTKQKTEAFPVAASINKMDTPPPVKTETVVERAVEPKSDVEETKSVLESSAVKSAVTEEMTETSPVAALVNEMDAPPSSVKSQIVEEPPEINSAVDPKNIVEEKTNVVETSVVNNAVTEQSTGVSPVAADPRVRVAAAVARVAAAVVAASKAQEPSSSKACSPTPEYLQALSALPETPEKAGSKVTSTSSGSSRDAAANVAPAVSAETTKADVTADTYFASTVDESGSSWPKGVTQSAPEARPEPTESTNVVAAQEDGSIGGVAQAKPGPSLSSNSDARVPGTNPSTSNGAISVLSSENAKEASPKVASSSSRPHLDARRRKRDLERQQAAEAFKGAMYNLGDVIVFLFKALMKEMPDRLAQASKHVEAATSATEGAVKSAVETFQQIPGQVNQTVTNVQTAVETSIETTKKTVGIVQAQVKDTKKSVNEAIALVVGAETERHISTETPPPPRPLTAQDMAWKVAGGAATMTTKAARWVAGSVPKVGFTGAKLVVEKASEKSEEQQRNMARATMEVKTTKATTTATAPKKESKKTEKVEDDWYDEVSDALAFAEKAVKMADEGKEKRKSDLDEAMKRAREAIDLATKQAKESENNNQNRLMTLVNYVHGVSDTANHRRKTISLSHFNNTLVSYMNT